MVNLYRKGRIAEGKIASDLRGKGFQNIRQSAGSRGPADIYASRNGVKYYFQVKSGAARLGSDGRQNLRQLAQDRRGVAVSIHRDSGQNQWRFLGNWSKRR